MKKIKMIAMDCDGTLLTSDKKLSERNRQALTAAIKKGVVVLPATGRPDSALPEEVLGIPGIRYAIASNGGRVIDLQENKMIYSKTMSLEEGLTILSVMAKYDTYKEVFFDGVGYGEEEQLKKIQEYVLDEYMGSYLLKTRNPVKDFFKFIREKNMPFDKVQAIFKNLEEKEQASIEIKKITGKDVIGAFANNIEVNADGVNKSEGISHLAEYLGITIEEVMTFGDGMNDLEMIRDAGYGIAMKNAVQDVKDVAYYITDTNDQDGVAQAIEKFVLI